jgi:hypothetical protein
VYGVHWQSAATPAFTHNTVRKMSIRRLSLSNAISGSELQSRSRRLRLRSSGQRPAAPPTKVPPTCSRSTHNPHPCHTAGMQEHGTAPVLASSPGDAAADRAITALMGDVARAGGIVAAVIGEPPTREGRGFCSKSFRYSHPSHMTETQGHYAGSGPSSKPPELPRTASGLGRIRSSSAARCPRPGPGRRRGHHRRAARS